MIDMRILAYCIMPNHWRLVLYPRNDGELGEYLRIVTTSHARRHRVATRTIGHGHVYQGPYKSFPVEGNRYLLELIRYVEHNPLRAGLVKRSEQWRWSSLWLREPGTPKQRKLLERLAIDLPAGYLELVNKRLHNNKLERVRHSINKGMPFGSDRWTERMILEHNLQSAARGPGRPRERM